MKEDIMREEKSYELPENFVTEVSQDNFSYFNTTHRVTNLLDEIIFDWEKFVREDKKYKELFSVGRERGWVLRIPKNKKNGEKYDHKEFFHFHKDFLDRLKLKRINYSKYERMFLNLGKLYKISVEASLEIAEKLDARFHGFSVKKHVKKSNGKRSTHVVRLLYYPKPKVSILEEKKAMLAKGHFDRNAWTFSWIETAPGLKLGLHLNIDCLYEKNKVLFFNGAKLENLIKALNMQYHGVIDESITSRVSIVFFAHVVLSEKITKEYIDLRKKELGL
jgi:hypothetical protein